MAECSALQFVSPYAFEAMQKVDVVRLAALSDPELRLLLPCLVRMALCAPADQSQSWAQDKKLILRLLSGVEAVNSIVALLSVDFHALEQDASKEQQLRHKLGGGSGESILVSQLQHGLTLEFEHSDSPRRLRLVLSELLAIMNKVRVRSPVVKQGAARLSFGWADGLPGAAAVLLCFAEAQQFSLTEHCAVLQLCANPAPWRKPFFLRMNEDNLF
ncbi:hypothetical protein ASZ78_009774 [Callipepla squamata]|uniref:Integrator complex subunit 2 n=1 Tax=Callipepla squamata TaxID=9009 RepID=A0A226NB95_CALSU|nr:hypothetical protein ASZ78_009774 [Callipepla squamata]